jgi:hypothetical protein
MGTKAVRQVVGTFKHVLWDNCDWAVIHSKRYCRKNNMDRNLNHEINLLKNGAHGLMRRNRELSITESELNYISQYPGFQQTRSHSVL